MNINNGHSSMSLINHRRRSARWHGASQKVGQSAAPLFLDRIDLQIELSPVPFSDLSKMEPGEPSEKIRERVIRARKIQEERFRDYALIHSNAQMTEKMLGQYCVLDSQTTEVLREAMIRLNLSARAYSRILKVARTIADLEGKENIEFAHVAEAVGYRTLDRSSWGE